MPKRKSYNSNKPDSYETRLVAAQSFTPGDLVRHRVTGQLGFFQETNFGFALPEVWIEFDSNTDSRISMSCNPLELELAQKDCCEHPTLKETSMDGEQDLYASEVILEPHELDLKAVVEDVEAQVPIGTCEYSQLVENELGKTGCSSRPDVLPPVMNEVEARQCLQEIKGLFDAARAKLLEFKERRGWFALKYPHLTACLEDHFPESRTKLVRELFAAEVERDILQVPIGTCPASHFRPLRKLKPEQYKSALDKAYELAGDSRLTSAHVTKAVNELLRPTRFVTQQPSKFQRSDLVRIKCAVGALPEQKAWDGCWAIVQSVGTISCVCVLVGSKEVDYMVGDLDWDDNSDPKFRDASERILTLWQTELEPIEQTVLKELQRRHFFTDLELQMISLIEAKRSSV